jgi:tRNA U34 5-methylaminomethyl-2-thiouridine-forming methyltransferase MnmC
LITLYTTKDQSHTLYNSELNETYHSRNGAVEEAAYVYLKQGLEFIASKQKELNVLEIGFGTGLNAILTLQKATQWGITCHYQSLETFPLPIELINQLNYLQYINPAYQTLFTQMHQCAWNLNQVINPNFQLHKIAQSIHQFYTHARFDLIYFDAFGPDKQTDMWTPKVFEKMYQLTSTQGILVTYSAKGEVKRTLKAVGYEVERLPGPPRKRHMLRAIKY